MIIPLALACVAQSPEVDAAAYVTQHSAADRALVARDWDEAQSRFQACRELAPDSATIAYGLACVASRAGRVEDAFVELKRAKELGFQDVALARWDEDLAALREDPRFQQWIRLLEAEEPKLSVDLERITLFEGAQRNVASITPDGRVVAIGGRDGSLLLVDSRTGAELRRWDAFDKHIWNIEFSQDGSLLVGVTYEGEIRAFDVSTGALVWSDDCLAGDEKYRYSFGSTIDFSADGERLFVALSRRGGVLLSLDGERIHRFDEPVGHFFGILARWSRDGSRLAVVRDQEVRLLEGRTAKEIETLSFSAGVASVDFSPDGTQIAVGLDKEAKGRIRDLATGEDVHSFEVNDIFKSELSIPFVRFSPDGSRLAYTSASSVLVQLDSLEEGKQIFDSGFLGGRMGEPVEAHFSPDGSQLWYAWRSGAMHFVRVDIESGQSVQYPSAIPPRFARNGLGVACMWGGISVFDANTGTFYWYRADAPSGEALLQSPGGYLSRAIPSLDGSEERVSETTTEWTDQVRQVAGEDRVDVKVRMSELYDPKRVRAAQAGVALAQP